MPLSFGDFVLDSAARQLRRGEAVRHLGPKALGLLELLLSRRPEVVARERIRNRLWPNAFVSDSTVATVVNELRIALADDPRHPRFLRTVYGVGYAFCGEASPTLSARPPDDERPAREALSGPSQPGPLDGTGPIESLAVLPFVDLSRTGGQGYFCDGLAAELVGVLARLQGLRVASLTSSLQFKGERVDVRDIGRQLGVRAVVEGSVRKAGRQLRTTVQVSDVRTGFSLFAASYERSLTCALETQKQIAEAVVSALESRMTGFDRPVPERVVTADSPAYDIYLHGQGLLHQLRVEAVAQAGREFEAAIEIDPSFVLAHVGLANASSWLYPLRGRRPGDLATALSASAKALDLRPDMAESHGARGSSLALAGDVGGSEMEYRTAIALGPELFEIHYAYARSCLEQGRLFDACRLFERAVRIRPADYQSRSLLSMVYSGLGEHEKAREVSAQAVVASMRHLEWHPEDARAACVTGTDLIRLGQVDRGLEWVERARRMDPDGGPMLYSTACAYALAGHSEMALDALEGTTGRAFANPAWIINDPDWTALRDHPRFQAFLNRFSALGSGGAVQGDTV